MILWEKAPLHRMHIPCHGFSLKFDLSKNTYRSQMSSQERNEPGVFLGVHLFLKTIKYLLFHIVIR